MAHDPGRHPLTLDQIGVSQTSLFWSDFDSDDADNVAVTIPTPLSSNVIYQGNNLCRQHRFAATRRRQQQFSRPGHDPAIEYRA